MQRRIHLFKKTLPQRPVTPTENEQGETKTETTEGEETGPNKDLTSID